MSNSEETKDVKTDSTENKENENLDENLDNTPEIDDEGVDEGTQQGGDDGQETPEKDTVPLATHLETKNALKQAKRKLAEVEDAKLDEEAKSTFNDTKQRWLDKGYDDNLAEAIAQEVTNLSQNIVKQKQTNFENILDSEIEEISQNTFYEDISQYAPAIKAKVAKAKKAGVELGVKEAYLSLVGVDKKLQEINTHESIKQQQVNRQQGTNKGSNVGTSASSGNKVLYNLDNNDKKALAKLKEMQPETEWSEKKYFELMKKEE